jgi:hypothetical protein
VLVDADSNDFAASFSIWRASRFKSIMPLDAPDVNGAKARVSDRQRLCSKFPASSPPNPPSAPVFSLKMGFSCYGASLMPAAWAISLPVNAAIQSNPRLSGG